MLWGAIPVAGHPGIVQIPPVQREIHFRLPSLSLAQRIAFLEALHVTKIELPHGKS
jgi:hypothetical protein